MDMLPTAPLPPVQKQDVQHKFLKHKGKHTHTHTHTPRTKEKHTMNEKTNHQEREREREREKEMGNKTKAGNVGLRELI